MKSGFEQPLVGVPIVDTVSTLLSLPPSLPDVLCDELRQRVTTGRLLPGPVSISSLAKEFGVSAVPVREALRRLEAEGLVCFNRNRSVTVRGLSISDLREVFLIRLALEPILLRAAAPMCLEDPNCFDELNKELETMDNSLADPTAWRDANNRFHMEMYTHARLPRLKDIVKSLWNSAEHALRIYAMETAALHIAQSQHADMLQLLRDGHTEALVALLKSHLEDTLSVVEATVARHQEVNLDVR